MKINALIQTVAVTLLLSCNNPTYKISGIIDDTLADKTVYLGYSVDGYNFTAVDSTTINDDRFEFNGNIKDSKIYYICYNNNTGPIPIIFILEPGEISMEISADYCRITGTHNNNLNQEIEDTILEYVNNITRAQETTEADDSENKEDIEEYTHVIEIKNNTRQYIKNVITENIESLTALIHLVTFAEFFSNEEFDRLIEQIPDKNKDRDNNPLFDILTEIQYERQYAK